MPVRLAQARLILRDSKAKIVICFFSVTAYSDYMGKTEKLLDKARNSPSGLKMQNFETLLRRCNWVRMRQEGSHRLWYSPQSFRLPIQPRKDGKAKAYQVRQFLEQYDKEEKHEDI